MNDLQTALEAQIAKHATPGASIAIWHEGRILEAAAGFANVPEGIAANTDTLFQIGSITKVFTATLIIRLVEQGLVELDAPVSRYLPELKIEGNASPDALTVRTLLDYSAGMEGDYFEDFGPDPRALAEYVSSCSDLQFIHPPGEMRGYNSTAYCIAGRLIEKVTEKYFNDALADELLAPLGCTRYGFYTHDVLRYRTAVGHDYDGKDHAIVENLRLPHCMSAAGASLTMTARDLLRFGCLHVQQGKTESGEQIVSEDGLLGMRTPYARVPPDDSELLMGWAALQAGDTRVTVASGATNGQNSFLAIIPEKAFAIAILSNSQAGATSIFLDLGLHTIESLTGLTAELPQPRSPTPDESGSKPQADELNKYCGCFCNGSEIEIERRGDELAATSRAKVAGTKDEFESATSILLPLGGNLFGVLQDGRENIVAVLEFIQENGDTEEITHIAQSGRIFGRKRQFK